MNKYIIHNKRVLIPYLVMVPFMALSSTLFAQAMEPLFDTAILREGRDLLFLALVFMGLGLIDMFFYYLHKICRERLRSEFLIGLKKDIFAGILNMDIGVFQKESPASYISLIQRDVKTINSSYFDSVCGIYRVTVSFIFTVTALSMINPWICLMNLLVAFTSVFLPRVFGKKIEKASQTASQNADAYQNVISDALLGFSTIKLFSISKKMEQQVDKRNIDNEKSEYQSKKLNFSVSYISIMCSQLGYMLTIFLGIIFVLYGKMSIGGVVAISQLIGGVLAPFEELPEFMTNLKSVKVIIAKVNKVIVRSSHIGEKEEKELEKFDIVVDNVSFRYDNQEILKNVNLTFEENKKYIILGESGCGKSTLAKTILNMYQGRTGRILLGNREVGDLPEEQLYRVVNYMQQEVFLFDDTIYNNITLYQEHSREEVNRVIETSGLKSCIEELEDGLNTVINGNGYNLSGGEKQRIGIARFLLSGARVLILDEITSNLDVVLGRKIEETVMQLPGVMVIMITHRIHRDTMAQADELVVLRGGEVQEAGTFEELMSKKGLFYSYYTISK